MSYLLSYEEIEELNELVKVHTAFVSYNDMMDAMEKGYIPSIYSNEAYRPKRTDLGNWVNFNSKQRLTELLVKGGWKVFDGKGIIGG